MVTPLERPLRERGVPHSGREVVARSDPAVGAVPALADEVGPAVYNRHGHLAELDGSVRSAAPRRWPGPDDSGDGAPARPIRCDGRGMPSLSAARCDHEQRNEHGSRGPQHQRRAGRHALSLTEGASEVTTE